MKRKRWCTFVNVLGAGSVSLSVVWVGSLLLGFHPFSLPVRAPDAGPPSRHGEQPAAAAGGAGGQPAGGGAGSGVNTVHMAESHGEVIRPPQPAADAAAVAAAPAAKSPQPSASPSPSRHMLRYRPLVSCGGHKAASCAECTASWRGEGYCHGDCVWVLDRCTDFGEAESLAASLPVEQVVAVITKEYCFQPVRTDAQNRVNIVLVRAPFRSDHQRQLFEKYKDKILFLGISSFEDFPLPPPNPFSHKFPADYYVGMFPGFLHMFRDPSVFPSSTKVLLLSQSDFALPSGDSLPKKYDFTFSGTDQDVANDCVGWSSFAKNWTFVLQALEVMCGEYGMTGVLVATKDKQGRKACTIPKSCEGKIVQTSFLDQGQFFTYVRQSHFVFVPQVHDASPRAASQALALNTPVLMNWHIVGGWKYVNEKTGEFFHDMSDFRQSLETVLRKAKDGSYQPQAYMRANYGDQIAGARFKDWIQDNFADRVKLPEGTRLLLPTGA